MIYDNEGLYPPETAKLLEGYSCEFKNSRRTTDRQHGISRPVEVEYSAPLTLRLKCRVPDTGVPDTGEEGVFDRVSLRKGDESIMSIRLCGHRPPSQKRLVTLCP